MQRLKQWLFELRDVLLTVLFFVVVIWVLQYRPTLAAEISLKIHRPQWSLYRLTSYRFTVDRSCMCPDSLRHMVIEVYDGLPETVTYSDGEKVTGPKIQQGNSGSYYTIDGLFETIEEAIEGQAHRVSVFYDPVYGYPREIKIDYWSGGSDEELFLRISGFKVLSR